MIRFVAGEITARLLEHEIDFKFRRVCTDGIIPYYLNMEDEVLPNVERIIDAINELSD